jgi:hypothetical protein
MALLQRISGRSARGFGLTSISRVRFSPQTYSTIGNYTFRIPPGNNSVVLTYPTPTGMVSTTIATIPNTDVAITVGDYGINSSFGATTIPAYTKTVLNHTSGNVDANLSQTYAVATTNAITVTSTGTNGTVSTAMNSGGIYFTYDAENSQGDFSETITVSTVPIATLLGTYRALGAVTSSRGESSCTITVQPTAANSYRASSNVTEGGYSNYPVLYNVILQQIGYLQVSESIT